MKQLLKILFAFLLFSTAHATKNESMKLYYNMNSRTTIGQVQLNNITSFEISETVKEISSTAKLTTPKGYGKIGQKPILEIIKVGDPVVIELGYDGQYHVEFSGYISEIESDAPLIISCDDAMWPYKQNNHIKSYKSTNLKQVLTELFPELIIDCPDVYLGRFQIDNASSFQVVQELQSNNGLYSRIIGETLKVGLAYDFADQSKTHVYDMRDNVRANDLKYKRKEDTQVRFKATANLPNGKKKTVTIGSKHPNASEKTLNFAGDFTEAQLKEKATACLSKVSFDGYTGSITGIGTPLTKPGDCLKLVDGQNPEREGTYMIESVAITYDQSGFSRKNTLSYKTENTLKT